MTKVDIVTVFHNDENWLQTVALWDAIAEVESSDDFEFHVVDNKKNNRGFGPGCNLGAQRGDAPYIGFLNPDVIVKGPFITEMEQAFRSVPNMVICGNRFNKPARELKVWGVKDWVCGATFFVRRDWFEEVGGFDHEYKWGWEETDLIRLAESTGKGVMSIEFPFEHASPTENSKEDERYKRRHFDRGARYYQKKWSKRG